jgi:hypothetical protein
MRILQVPEVFHMPLTTKKVLGSPPFEVSVRLTARAPTPDYKLQLRVFSLNEEEAGNLGRWCPAEHRRRDEVSLSYAHSYPSNPWPHPASRGLTPVPPPPPAVAGGGRHRGACREHHSAVLRRRPRRRRRRARGEPWRRRVVCAGAGRVHPERRWRRRQRFRQR